MSSSNNDLSERKNRTAERIFQTAKSYFVEMSQILLKKVHDAELLNYICFWMRRLTKMNQEKVCISLYNIIILNSIVNFPKVFIRQWQNLWFK